MSEAMRDMAGAMANKIKIARERVSELKHT